MTENQVDTPFTRGYVLRTTLKHMNKSVEISKNKTLARIEEFEGNSQKSQEVLATLGDLTAIETMLKDFASHNKEILKAE